MARKSWRRDCTKILFIETQRRVGNILTKNKLWCKDRIDPEGVFGLVNGSKNQRVLNQ